MKMKNQLLTQGRSGSQRAKKRDSSVKPEARKKNSSKVRKASGRRKEQKEQNKVDNQTKVKNNKTVTQESMRLMAREAIVGAMSEDAFQIKCEPVLQTLESKQVDWVPLKVKKQVADVIKEVIKASPIEHSAQQKLFALKLLNKSILLNC